MIPTPNEIFARLERGEIERDEMQALMALHARELIAEMVEDHQNPVAALIEQLLARRLASKLVSKHGGRLIREVLFALSAVPDFPPSRLLWNAMHADVPLHCYFRIRRNPIFRLLSVEKKGETVTVEVQYGTTKKDDSTQRKFKLRRGLDWQLAVVDES